MWKGVDAEYKKKYLIKSVLNDIFKEVFCGKLPFFCFRISSIIPIFVSLCKRQVLLKKIYKNKFAES